MSPEPKKDKSKKPKIDYKLLEDGNIIDANVDDTHFVFIKKQTQTKKKAGGKVNLTGLGVEGETEQRSEWTGIVWEPEEGSMPRSVWDEKRKREILDKMKMTISQISGVAEENIELNNQSGTVNIWNPISITCRYCNSTILSSSKYCNNCGKEI